MHSDGSASPVLVGDGVGLLLCRDQTVRKQLRDFRGKGGTRTYIPARIHASSSLHGTTPCAAKEKCIDSSPFTYCFYCDEIDITQNLQL